MTFEPHTVTTRGMIGTILWRLEGSPSVNHPMDYDDVKLEDWYGEAVRRADSAGVVNGYDNGKFGPNAAIICVQMAAMLWRYAGSLNADGSLSSFVDGAQTSGLGTVGHERSSGSSVDCLLGRSEQCQIHFLIAA